MSVNITFEPAGLTGVVAEGIHVLDAAKRMGVRFDVECRGREQCQTCLVIVEEGVALLSMPSEAERQILGQLGMLAQNQRMACHAIIERKGEIIVTIPELDSAAKKEEPMKDVRKAFGQLPLNQKLAALVQLEAATMSEALDIVVGRTRSVGGKMLDLLARKTGSTVQSRTRRRDKSANAKS